MYSTDTIYLDNFTIKPYKFRRLDRDKMFWTAWNTGNIEGKSKTKILYKLTSAMRWARFTKPEILHMLKSWHRKHRLRYDPAQLELIYIAVGNWLQPRMRERKRLEMQRYRGRQRQQKLLETVKVRAAGGEHE